jgi:hypothetical protein
MAYTHTACVWPGAVKITNFHVAQGERKPLKIPPNLENIPFILYPSPLNLPGSGGLTMHMVIKRIIKWLVRAISVFLPEEKAHELQRWRRGRE